MRRTESICPIKITRKQGIVKESRNLVDSPRPVERSDREVIFALQMFIVALNCLSNLVTRTSDRKMDQPLQSSAGPSVEAESKPRKPRGARAHAGNGGKANKPVNLRDVAKMAGVSVATVSMVINDNPRISRATHMRVQRLIER